MKKLLSCFVIVAMMLTLVSAFAACGGEEKNTEANTEAKTEAKTDADSEGETEKKTEANTEEQTEAKTEEQTEEQTEPVVVGDPVVLPENTKICSMQLNSFYVEFGVPADSSSIVDAWSPGTDQTYDRGLTFCMSEEDYPGFVEIARANGDGTTFPVLDDAYNVLLTNPEKTYMYNGEPGDADFGTKVNGTVAELFNGCLGFVDPDNGGFGPYIWVGNLWAYTEDSIFEPDVYTFVIYNDDGTAVAFSEYVLQSFYEHAYYYYWE